MIEKSSIKLNLNLTFEKNKTERYQIGSSTNALIDLRYGSDGVGGYKFLSDNGNYMSTLPTGGTEGQILKIVNGNPKWVDPS